MLQTLQPEYSSSDYISSHKLATHISAGNMLIWNAAGTTTAARPQIKAHIYNWITEYLCPLFALFPRKPTFYSQAMV